MSFSGPTNNVEYTPVQDILIPVRAVPQPPLDNLDNLIDTLSEPQPSTSRACSNQCPPEKLKKKKVPKEERLLINFSSSSCSSESMSHNKTEVKEKEVQCELANDVKNMSIYGNIFFFCYGNMTIYYYIFSKTLI